MAKFRQYKNGIFGHRYKKFYITRNNNNQYKTGKLYTIIDENENVILKDNPDFEDCEWYIDKITATDEEMELYKTLYNCNIATLFRMAQSYSQKTEDGIITKEEKKLYGIIEKVMRRKKKDLEF